MAAIAYGAWLGGWLADRFDPRALIAPALLLAAVATTLTLPIVRWAGELLRGSAAGGVLLLTALTVFVPAVLLAAITPLVIKLQLGDLRQTGLIVGKLSSIGTLGGITATLGTGFVLVAALRSSVIVLSLAGLLGIAGVAAGWYLRSLGDLASLRTRAVVAVVGLTGVGLAAVAPDPCDIETAYHCARVETDPARPGGRLLVLNSAHHSYVDLTDPRYLDFEYTQWIGALADLIRPLGQPLDALHLGGGGFTLPRYLTATRPGTTNTVLELDGKLVELNRAQLGLDSGPDLDVHVGDARIALAGQPSGTRDIVIGDAFGHLAVPWHLTTRELVTDVRRTLLPDGVYALNVIDGPTVRFARAEIATVASVFRHVAAIAPEEAFARRAGANFVILGSDAPLPLEALRQRLAAADSTVRVLDGAALAAFTRDARVLTDDYAPVDQLLAY